MNYFLQFIEDTNNATSEDEVFHLFQQQLERLGFDRVLYTLVNDHASIDQKAGHGIMRNYPEDWMAHYTEKKYVDIDPVIKHAAISSAPFVWENMQDVMPFTREQQRLINESKEARLFNGMGLGIHGANNEMVAMGFASSERDVDISKDRICYVRALANQFHFAYCEIKKRQKKSHRQDLNLNLTRRELEVLTWLASGKSKYCIAAIMSIAESSVDYHTRSIFKKLQVNDRTLAIVKAIKYGLIRI